MSEVHDAVGELSHSGDLRCQLDPVARAITPLWDSVRPDIVGLAWQIVTLMAMGPTPQTRAVGRMGTQNKDLLPSPGR